MSRIGTHKARAAFSVDVEDYFQAEMLREFCPRERWGTFEDRTVSSTERLLEMANAHAIKGTFFVLGWTAERHPDLVRRIATLGHEIASHGYSHDVIYSQTPNAFRDDVRRARSLLQDLTSQPVVGYRAPSYTVMRKTWWALPILVDEGHLYDSSIFPIRRRRYGMPEAPRLPHRIQLDDERSIVEFPLPTVRLGRVNLPVTGGAYLRLLPISFQHWWVSRAVRRSHPFVLNIHPWELDPSQPRFPVRTSVRITHYHGQGQARARLDRLLSLARYRTQWEVLADLGLLAAPVAVESA